MRNKLILASASPRRLDLLKQIHIEPALVAAADVDETPFRNEKPDAHALRLARAKCEKISALHPGNFVLAADTVVACGPRILPKAETEQEALSCLNLISGRRHHVYGGMALASPDGKIRTRLCDTMVQFRTLTPQDIESYIASREWDGKAGGYAIQGQAEGFIKFIRGSYSNVVGLSLYDTLQMLNGAGFKQG